MTTTHAQRKALGDFGERLALRRLVAEGYAVLDRNWRCPDGEIDIVARVADVLVVCEVKTRSSIRFGTPLQAISREKADRLHRLGRRWLAAHPEVLTVSFVRVDIVAVLRRRRGQFELEHVVGVV